MMANYLSTSLFLILGIAVLWSLALPVHAKPMDAEAAKKIPELKHILLNVLEKGRLADQDRLAVEGNLASGDSVIAKGGAFRQLHKMGKAANAVPVPMPDERYELLLSIIEAAEGK